MDKINENNTIPTEQRYTIALDELMLNEIQDIIMLEKIMNAAEPCSIEYEQAEANLEDKLKDLGWYVVYDFKELPF